MQVVWRIETGWPQWLNLRRRVGALRRHSIFYKIGITNDPDRRARQYYDEYDEMIVIYQTQSLASARWVERDLIDFTWDDTDNEVGGGGGNFGEPPYFVYVVRDRA